MHHEGFSEAPAPRRRALNAQTLSAGIVAAIFGCVATSLIVVNAGNEAGLSDAQVASWLFAVWFFGGVLGIIMAWTTRQPISGAWSIPAAVMLGGALPAFAFEQAVGAYFMSGVIVLVLGWSGLITWVMRWIPMPVIMAMIAGALMRFASSIVDGLQQLPLVVGAAVLAYFLAQRMIRRISPVIPAFIVGILAAVATGVSDIGAMEAVFSPPIFTAPSFSLDAFLAIAIPVAVLVIGAENAQATGVLMSEGYRPPVKAMTVASGIGGMVASFLGGHNANIAGPMTAICSSEAAGPDKSQRYMASIVNGALCALFGLFSSYAIAFIRVVPVQLVMAVAGLAMISVLVQALQLAFNEKAKAQVGAFVAFIVALSGVNFLDVTAPFWSLVAGVAIAWLTDGKLGGRVQEQAEVQSPVATSNP